MAGSREEDYLGAAKDQLSGDEVGSSTMHRCSAQLSPSPLLGTARSPHWSHAWISGRSGDGGGCS